MLMLRLLLSPHQRSHSRLHPRSPYYYPFLPRFRFLRLDRNGRESGAIHVLKLMAIGAGAEVDKYILQRWYMRARYPMLGQRPDMHIPLPARSERTARVSCGDGEGQCRWYDEWDPHHLSDFNSWRAQSTL